MAGSGHRDPPVSKSVAQPIPFPQSGANRQKLSTGLSGRCEIFDPGIDGKSRDGPCRTGRGYSQAISRLRAKIFHGRFRNRLFLLSYLKRLPLDELKIDRSFITDLPNKSEDQALVSAMIYLAHEFKLQGRRRRRGNPGPARSPGQNGM